MEATPGICQSSLNYSSFPKMQVHNNSGIIIPIFRKKHLQTTVLLPGKEKWQCLRAERWIRPRHLTATATRHWEEMGGGGGQSSTSLPRWLLTSSKTAF